MSLCGTQILSVRIIHLTINQMFTTWYYNERRTLE